MMRIVNTPLLHEKPKIMGKSGGRMPEASAGLEIDPTRGLRIPETTMPITTDWRFVRYKAALISLASCRRREPVSAAHQQSVARSDLIQGNLNRPAFFKALCRRWSPRQLKTNMSTPTSRLSRAHTLSGTLEFDANMIFWEASTDFICPSFCA